jgi:hypothetical protein
MDCPARDEWSNYFDSFEKPPEDKEVYGIVENNRQTYPLRKLEESGYCKYCLYQNIYQDLISESGAPKKVISIGHNSLKCEECGVKMCYLNSPFNRSVKIGCNSPHFLIKVWNIQKNRPLCGYSFCDMNCMFKKFGFVEGDFFEFLIEGGSDYFNSILNISYNDMPDKFMLKFILRQYNQVTCEKEEFEPTYVFEKRKVWCSKTFGYYDDKV